MADHPIGNSARPAILMRLRIPFFMKKRGRRRTGARWFGPLGEAVWHAVFVLVGAFALVQLAIGELTPPWPWLVAIIPASLLVYGVVGLAKLLWEGSTSTELRAAVAQKAADLESLLSADPRHQNLPAVPSIEQVVDSPGVRLAYRLPIDTSPNWLLVGMTLICVFWNVLVGFFVYYVAAQHADGRPNWLLTWLIVPFLLAGLWIIVVLAREIYMTTGIGTTRLEIAHHPLIAGQSCPVFISQAGRANIRWLKVYLLCEERAIYPQGTDTRTEVQRASRSVLYRARKFDITPDAPFEAEFALTIPAGAMHSFVAPHNAVQWSLVVRGMVARTPIFERRFPVYVYPEPVVAPGGTPKESEPAERRQPERDRPNTGDVNYARS